jgi:hypothetical protein
VRTPRAFLPIVLVLAALTASCAPRAPKTDPLDAVAERYVKLVLAMGLHDADYVDAYYGPPEWRAEAQRESMSLDRLDAVSDSLRGVLGAMAPAGDELHQMRQRYLGRQLDALSARVHVMNGAKLSFDEESQALYDAVAPPRSDAEFEAAIARLDSLIPGRGPIPERYERYRKQFEIPRAKLDTVFAAAIAEARRRTREHLALPDSESFTVAIVTNQPWGGYNWYKGGYHSLIEVNADLPTYIDRAIDLACHEGYPGHHVYNVLLERALVRERGWKEFTVYPLFSPQSLIAEGTAVVATEVAFTRAEKIDFEKRVLYPLAGLDSSEADRYERIHEAMEALDGAGVEAARRFLDGHASEEQTVRWLMSHALSPRARAEHSIQFDRRYRSYVVNYTLGKELVRAWLAKNGGGPDAPAKRWELYQTLLASPRLPGDLK